MIRRLFSQISNSLRQLTPDQRLRLRRIVILLWLAVLIGLAVWVLRTQRSNLETIWSTLKDANRGWLLVCLVAELAGISSVALTYSLILRRLKHPVSVGYLGYVHVQRAGVGFAAPFGGPITAYVFAERMKRKQVPAEDALLCLVIRTTAVWGATLVVAVLTAALSGRPVLIAGAIAALLGGTALAFLVARTGQGDWRTVLRLAKRMPVRHQERFTSAIDRFKAHDLTPGDLLQFIGTTLMTRTATMSLIYACVRALGFDPAVSTIFIAYVVSFVAGRLVPFLYSMGAIEGSLSLALERGGVPLEIAIGATLLFRFFDFFLPSMVGLALYTWDERRQVSGPAVSATPSRPDE